MQCPRYRTHRVIRPGQGAVYSIEEAETMPSSDVHPSFAYQAHTDGYRIAPRFPHAARPSVLLIDY